MHYCEILDDKTDEEREAKADAFYEENREEMDKGWKTLWSRWTYSALMKKKSTLGTKAFNSEYMNIAYDPDSQIFNEDNIIFFDDRDLIDQWGRRIPLDIYGFWDLAVGKGNKRDDYNAVVIIGRDSKADMNNNMLSKIKKERKTDYEKYLQKQQEEYKRKKEKIKEIKEHRAISAEMRKQEEYERKVKIKTDLIKKITLEENKRKQLEITSAYDQNDLLPLELRENNKIICYNSDIDILKERNNSFLKYIILLTNSEETANSEYVAYLEKDIESITYIFETKKENGDKVYEMIKNKILNTDLVNNKYYKIYTITNKNIINWIEENGNAKKCLRSCNDQSIEGATSIKFKTEKSKKRVGLLINVQDFEKNIDVVQLQKKIIAVQSLKPKVEQLQKDISPEWVAKRLNFSSFDGKSKRIVSSNLRQIA